MHIVKYVETYDTIISILDTVKYGSRSLTTKDQLLRAINELIEVTADFTDIRTIRFYLDSLLFSVKPVEGLPDGTVADEVKMCVTRGIRSVQRSIAVAFYNEYYEKDIDEYAEACPELLRNVVADVMLGDYRLGGVAA